VNRNEAEALIQHDNVGDDNLSEQVTVTSLNYRSSVDASSNVPEGERMDELEAIVRYDNAGDESLSEGAPVARMMHTQMKYSRILLRQALKMEV